MSDLPLWEAVRDYLASAPARFHTPGHAGRAEALEPLSGILPYDLTEVEGLDALYEPTGALLASEQAAARFFGAASTLYSAGGATLCIQTMLGLAAKKGGRVVFARNLHRSAIHTCALLDLHPVFLYGDEKQGGRVNPQELESLLSTQDIDAVYLTSPDYYGRLQDIPRIAEICDAHGLPLLVDNAHGTHLIFFGMHPLQLGAAMTACSAHKTLPVLTGGAYLHLADETYAGRAKQVMSVFGSTSPSYPVLLSLELCRDWCEREGASAFAALKEQAERLQREAQALGFSFERTLCDPVRFRLQTGQRGMDGVQAAALFRENGIEPEFADRDNLVLILTPFHTEEEFCRISRALRMLGPGDAPFPAREPVRPEMPMSVREAVFAESRTVSTEQAAGRIAAQAACPCPPGVPAVIPGERIDRRMSEILVNSGITEIKVVK